jgi:Fic family protein
MDEKRPNRRHSKADAADLVQDPLKKAERESLNALRQFDRGIEVVRSYLETGRPFTLRLSLILDLHRVALDGLSAYAGNFRPAGVAIEGSDHEPEGAHLVPSLVEEMCDYVNENWEIKSGVHLSAYIMWRLNWIHPFSDGNGRTSRILSYVILCLKLGYVLLGTKTIPDFITENRKPYFDALEGADEVHRKGKMDLSEMENLLEILLAEQLLTVVQSATGKGEQDNG